MLDFDRANVLWEQYSIDQAAICDEVESDGLDPESMEFKREVERRMAELRKSYPWEEMIKSIGGDNE